MELRDFLGKFEFEQMECDKHGTQSRVKGTTGCPKCDLIAIQEKSTEDAKNALKAHRMVCANIPIRYKTQEFEKRDDEARANAILASKFIDDAGAGWAACLITGTHGSGKTLLSSRIISRFIAKYAQSARYETCKSMINEIRRAYSTECMTEASQIDKYARYDLLVIDEVDVVTDNEYTLLSEVVGLRYANNKPLCIISNKTPQELERIIGERIMSRMSENCTTIVFCGEDKRKM